MPRGLWVIVALFDERRYFYGYGGVRKVGGFTIKVKSIENPLLSLNLKVRVAS
jgi:hypothetical protein